MKVKADPRHCARKLALTSIFSWLFSEPDISQCLEVSKEHILSDTCEYDEPLYQQIVEGVKEHRQGIDGIIQECAPEWPLEKISKVDLVILRIAIFELVYGKNTPVKVSIDEGVELAKEFGGETSHKFVNGVLGTVVDRFIEKDSSKKKKEEKAEEED
jgi:N utilization substance protein B